MTPYDQRLGNCGKEKLPFNRKKPPAEPVSGRGGDICCDQLGVNEGRQNKRHTVEASQMLITNYYVFIPEPFLRSIMTECTLKMSSLVLLQHCKSAY